MNIRLTILGALALSIACTAAVQYSLRERINNLNDQVSKLDQKVLQLEAERFNLSNRMDKSRQDIGQLSDKIDGVKLNPYFIQYHDL